MPSFENAWILWVSGAYPFAGNRDIPAVPLSDVAIRKAKPAAKPQKLADGDSLYLRMNPAGSKLGRWKYRVASKEKLLALGAYLTISLTSAREACNEARRMLAQGIDPGAAKKNAKQAHIESNTPAVTFKQVAEQWMLRQEVAEVTANKSRWILQSFLYPDLGDRLIAEIDSRELLEALRKIGEAGRLEAAKLARVKAAHVFHFAVLERLAASARQRACEVHSKPLRSNTMPPSTIPRWSASAARHR